MAVAAAGPSSPSPSALMKQHLGRILASTPVSSSFGVHSSAHFFPSFFLCILFVSSFCFPFFVCVICSDVLAQLTLELHFGINSHNNFFKEGYFLVFRIMVGQEICLWMKS